MKLTKLLLTLIFTFLFIIQAVPAQAFFEGWETTQDKTAVHEFYNAGAVKTTEEVVSNLGKSYGKFGTVVENPRVKVTGFSGHSVNQAITRGVTTDVIQNTVKNPVVVLSQRGGNSFAYISNEAVVVVKNTGEIITTYGKSNFDATVQQVLKEAIK